MDILEVRNILSTGKALNKFKNLSKRSLTGIQVDNLSEKNLSQVNKRRLKIVFLVFNKLFSFKTYIRNTYPFIYLVP